MKNFALIVFYFVIPFLQSPDWCVAYYKENKQKGEYYWIYDCKVVDNGHILYSNLPKFNPVLSACIDFICIGSLAFYMWFKTTWRQFS